MALFRKNKQSDWQALFRLSEDFRSLDRSPPQYPLPLDGLVLTREKLDNLLEAFCRQDRPVIHLYLPRSDREEAREFLVRRLGDSSLTIQDNTGDREAADFIRIHTPVRFGFEHANYTYIFETDLPGKIEDEAPLFLAAKPKMILQERRSHKRYQLYPEHEALINDMQVHDISRKGLQFFSEDASLQYQDVLENAALKLPPVYDAETDACSYSGADIEIPRGVITYKLKKGKYCYYGLQFQGDWPDEYLKNLDDFLLALRNTHSMPERSRSFLREGA